MKTMRFDLLVLAVLWTSIGCAPAGAPVSNASHEPLVEGGTGRGVAAEMTDGGLKWDARALIRFTGDSFEITNLDSFDWTRVRLSVNATWDGKTYEPGYKLRTGTLRAGRTYTASCGIFATEAGHAYDPRAEPPRTFWIECHSPDELMGGCEAAWPR